MRYLLTLFPVFLLVTNVLLAQPANDQPCDAIDLGTLTETNPITVNATNIGATSENYIPREEPDFDYCLEQEVLRNTVYFQVAIDHPSIRGFNLTFIPSGNTVHQLIFIQTGFCGATGPTFFSNTALCAESPGDTLRLGFSCLQNDFDFGIIINSQDNANEGDFELIIEPIAPTYCDACQNGEETQIDGPYIVTDATTTPANQGFANGLFTVNDVIGGRNPLLYSVDGGAFQNETTFDGLAAGNYTLTVQDDDGCTTSFPFEIEEIPTPPSPEAVSPPPYCLGDDLEPLTATGTDLRWYADEDLTQLLATGDSLQPDASIDTVYVTQTVDGFESLPTVVIITFAESETVAAFAPQPRLGYAPLEVTFENQSEFANSYLWDLGDGTSTTEESPMHIYADTGTYVVTLEAVSDIDCNDIITDTIRVLPPIIVPNAISPNGDGVNDLWVIDQISEFPGHAIRVYSQWGALVYEDTDYQNDWDGENLPDATYFYVVDLPEDLPDLTGYLLIMR